MKSSPSIALLAALVSTSALSAEPLAAKAAAEHAEAANPPPASEANVLEGLTEPELDQAMKLLESRFVTPQSLGAVEIKRATVQGLIERLKPGAELVDTSANPATQESPFRADTLDGSVGYLRVGTVTAQTLPPLDAALADFAAKNLGAVVLDFRASGGPSNYDLAADLCRRFCPKSKTLFTVRRPRAKDQIYTTNGDPKFKGVIVALISGSTTGTAEVTAAVLRSLSGAMIVGQQTKGEGTEFAIEPLGNGKALRFAVAEAILPDSQPIGGAGVKPDLAVAMSPASTSEVLEFEWDKGVNAALLEMDRPHLNEAALVAGTNPDLEAYTAAQKTRGEKPKRQIKDPVLQRALDFVTTLAVYEKGKAASGGAP